jgi:hypothetical protein
MEASGTAEEGRGPKDSFDRIGEAVLGGLLRCSIAMLTQSPSHRGTGLPPTAGMVAKVFGRSAPPAASVPIIAQLKIRGLAISRGKSTVLINDQTVRPGETVDIRLADRQARLSCIEIRPGRAVVKIDGGAPEELLLE